MTARTTRRGRTVKPVDKFDGDVGKNLKQKKPLKQSSSAVTEDQQKQKQEEEEEEEEVEEEDDLVSDTDEPEGTIAFKKVLIIIAAVQVQAPRHKAHPTSRKIRSPTPPDDFLPKISTRLTVKCSGTTMQTTKIVSLDFNLDFDEFNEILLPLIHAKAGETYDPINFNPASLSLKYSIIPTARITTLSKKPLHLSDYCDLDDDLDYNVLQGEIKNLLSQGRRSSDHLGKNTLTMHATLIKSSDSSRQRVNERAPAIPTTPTTPTTPQRIVSFLKLHY
jgi:hypothetical protein